MKQSLGGSTEAASFLAKGYWQ